MLQRTLVVTNGEMSCHPHAKRAITSPLSTRSGSGQCEDPAEPLIRRRKSARVVRNN
jgi:hypothetical protein